MTDFHLFQDLLVSVNSAITSGSLQNFINWNRYDFVSDPNPQNGGTYYYGFYANDNKWFSLNLITKDAHGNVVDNNGIPYVDHVYLHTTMTLQNNINKLPDVSALFTNINIPVKNVTYGALYDLGILSVSSYQKMMTDLINVVLPDLK